MVVLTPRHRATPLYLGAKVSIGGVDRLLGTTAADVLADPKLCTADLDALTKIVLTILPAEETKDSGFEIGGPFTKRKTTTSFAAILPHLPAKAEDKDAAEAETH